ncbi:MAG: RpiB/LacA/LacB family sugar-phosphate isomerase [Clostridium sp.]|nr:RpiB/LacA/LacB family sugar-phosphate isomerase [Clostridium sp.]
MKIAVGAQGSAFELKEAVKKALSEKGHEVFDVGQTDPEDTRHYFVDSVEQVAEMIISGRCQRGIVMCGSGAGVSLVANKIKGIYCVACESIFTAERIHLFNQANVMAMGAMAVSREKACEMALAFVDSRFGGGGALEHVKKIEEKYFK